MGEMKIFILGWSIPLITILKQMYLVTFAQVWKSGVSCPTRNRDIKQLTLKHTGRKDSINNLYDLMHGHFTSKYYTLHRKKNADSCIRLALCEIWSHDK